MFVKISRFWRRTFIYKIIHKLLDPIYYRRQFSKKHSDMLFSYGHKHNWEPIRKDVFLSAGDSRMVYKCGCGMQKLDAREGESLVICNNGEHDWRAFPHQRLSDNALFLRCKRCYDSKVILCHHVSDKFPNGREIRWEINKDKLRLFYDDALVGEKKYSEYA
jgi:hypothetical protein